jgi:tetratricopeptide (TPR) repeat protein
MLPHARVILDTRYVDNGQVITAGGVSSGIHCALHLIARIKGNEVAEATASIMDVKDWKRENGVDHYTPGTFEGEMVNLAADYLDSGQFRPAADLMESAVKRYPHSVFAYILLRKAFIGLGRAVPAAESAFLQLVDSGKYAEADSLFSAGNKAFPGWPLFGEQAMNAAGYVKIQEKDYTSALRIFTLNSRAYPDSYNTWDSMAEAYMDLGDRGNAIFYYKKSLELNPGNGNARNFLKKLGVEL